MSNKGQIRPEDKKTAPIRGMGGAVKAPEGPVSNPLSERIKDISKLLIPRGNVLLKIIEKQNVANDIYLPDTVDKAQFGGMYYVVHITGNDQFKEKHPEFVNDSQTQVGNIVISLKPTMSKVLTNNGQEYIQVHESLIESQVHPDNFNGF